MQFAGQGVVQPHKARFRARMTVDGRVIKGPSGTEEDAKKDLENMRAATSAESSKQRIK